MLFLQCLYHHQIKISCNFSGFSEQKITEKIIPAPQKVPKINLNKNIDPENIHIFDNTIYENSEVYPLRIMIIV